MTTYEELCREIEELEITLNHPGGELSAWVMGDPYEALQSMYTKKSQMEQQMKKEQLPQEVTQKEELKKAVEALAGVFNPVTLRKANAHMGEFVTRAGNTTTGDGTINLDLYFVARVLEETTLKLARVIEEARELLS